MKKTNSFFTLVFMLLLSVVGVKAQAPVASFTADEASLTYYEQGWDSESDFSKWTYSANTSYVTWELAEKPSFSGTSFNDGFNKIEKQSKYSLAIEYSSSYKDESATSPAITVRDNSNVEYYVCLYSVWYFNADLKFFVTDVNTGEKEQLVSTFIWAQDNGFTGPNWVKFSFDLSKYAGKTCQFSFQYVGTEGENAYIDGFRLKQKDDSDNSVITIFEGEDVHFCDLSSNAPTSWKWQLEGATPNVSTEQNPVVSYNQVGDYSVSLTAENADGSSTYTRQNYIHVIAQSPVALIGVPDEGYLSPWVYCFVPLNTAVQFKDLSTGRPTSWNWTFEGATPSTSTEQNPIVEYGKEGVYGLTLDVENAAGQSNDFLKNAIQAGGTQDVWNIQPEETADLGRISLGFYGNYAGTNWLGMKLFAEHYKKPVVAASIDKVKVYFETTTTVTPDAPITVSICRVGSDGNPGEELASSTLRADELVYDKNEVVPTEFVFSQPVRVDDEFFVTIGPFPNNSTDKGYDDISILCVRRDEGQVSTTWHLLEDEDAQGNSLGTFQWYRNVDGPLSMAVTPSLTYQIEENSISQSQLDKQSPYLTSHIEYYNVLGQCLGNESTNLKGVVIVKGTNGKTKKILR